MVGLRNCVLEQPVLELNPFKRRNLVCFLLNLSFL